MPGLSGGDTMKLNLLRKRMKMARKRDSDVLQFLKKFDEVQKRTAKSKLVLPLVLTIVFLSANWSHAETLGQLRNRIDLWLTNKVPVLVAKQTIYFSTHAKYWQGLITHSAIPSHVTAIAGDVAADRLTFTPSDVAESWADIVPEFNLEVFAAAARVDQYSGEQGKGWVLTVWVRFNSAIYVRAKGFGPETNHDHDWRVYDALAQ